ncbi:MAG: alpha/beta hydrolase [Oscillospiraceae bacterium]|jgi:acetyl esterase/lipase|nr:alpha/beta hydrolase [Oscillospiraceae bacterium]
MGVKLMPKEDVIRMFSRVDEAMPDTSVIRRKFLNCPYGEDPRQILDIYLPNEGAGPFPVVFFLHGGAWMSGAPGDAQMAPFIKGTERGYAFVSVGYRLVPHVRYPDNLFDVRCALRWVADNADTYLLDTSRTALAGASAGAQLALMAAFTAGVPAFDDAPGARTCEIRAVVDQFGPSEFLRKHAQFDESGYPRADDPESEEKSAVDIMLGARLEAVPNLARFISPLDNVHPGVPPTFIMHGRYDPVVPYQQSVELFEKINAVAGPGRSELWISEEFLHADPGFAGEEGVERIFTFLDKYLK